MICQLAHARGPASGGAATSGDNRMTVRSAESSPLRQLATGPGRVATVASLMVALVILATMGPVQRLVPTASAQGPVMIRISYQPIPIAAPLIVAKEKGYFEKAGVNVELVELWQSSETLASFAAGDVVAAAG